MQQLIKDFIKSWSAKEGVYSSAEILSWINDKNNSTIVRMSKSNLNYSKSWFLDNNGMIVNKNSSFFKICGLKTITNDDASEQPIILQKEIGFLGIICKRINGLIHFLMQAKIEPGNINKVQISPTIQATKSNFEQKHGGKKPNYFDYFRNPEESIIVVDQIQSEQAGRFLGKRNRNIVLYTEKEINEIPSHRWMTLGQLKELMKIDNVVNMDTRTVLSCLPFSLFDIQSIEVNDYFSNPLLCNSIFNDDEIEIGKVFHLINDYKMFSSTNSTICRLDELKEWGFIGDEFRSTKQTNFKIVFYNIEIEGREVKKWDQPLFEANGSAIFVLFVCNFNGKYKFLVRLSSEPGSFDKVELGPTIQNEFLEIKKMPSNEIETIFLNHIKSGDGILYDGILSEEGGRFYHEQNKNVILEIKKDELNAIPEGYLWLDYKTLNYIVQFNNVLNIQLRNLLSLLEA